MSGWLSGWMYGWVADWLVPYGPAFESRWAPCHIVRDAESNKMFALLLELRFREFLWWNVAPRPFVLIAATHMYKWSARSGPPTMSLPNFVLPKLLQYTFPCKLAPTQTLEAIGVVSLSLAL